MEKSEIDVYLKASQELYDKKNKKKWSWETKFWDRFTSQSDWSDKGIEWIEQALRNR